MAHIVGVVVSWFCENARLLAHVFTYLGLVGWLVLPWGIALGVRGKAAEERAGREAEALARELRTLRAITVEELRRLRMGRAAPAPR